MQQNTIEAHDAGADVLIISKSVKGNPHTTIARGGINAALGTMDPEDRWMIHAADTLREGEFLSDYERVELLCKSVPEAINELVNWGARFHRGKWPVDTTIFWSPYLQKNCILRDWTGKEIIRVLIDQVNQRKIKSLDDVYITKLLKSAGLIKEEKNEITEVTRARYRY